MTIFRFAIAAAPQRLADQLAHSSAAPAGHSPRAFVKSARKSPDHPAALFRILDFRIERVGIFRQIGFLHEPSCGVFIGGQDKLGLNSEPFGDIDR